MSSFAGMSDAILECGLFNSLYTDRGSHYWHRSARAYRAPSARCKVACGHAARSPAQEIGRRGHHRCGESQALSGAALLPAHNREFMVAAAEAGSAFVPRIGADLRDIPCRQEARVVRPDNCVAYDNKPCRYRRTAIVVTTSTRKCACTNAPTIASLCSTDTSLQQVDVRRVPTPDILVLLNSAVRRERKETEIQGESECVSPAAAH
jgi:hypothetical protein